MLEGMLLVNKPSGITSHDVVQLVRRKLGVRQVGHTGTLDPMAEGLLILLVGRATRSQQAFQAHEKVYEACLRLGTQTDTADATGHVVRTAPSPTLEWSRVIEVLTSFEGALSQTPPTYSAVKVQGHPAYWWARRHRPVTLAPRIIQIADLSLVQLGADTITFRVRCSAGTYVRTLAESIAQQLGTVGHLAGLVRQRVGQWSLEDAVQVDWIAQTPSEIVARHLVLVASIPLSAQPQ